MDNTIKVAKREQVVKPVSFHYHLFGKRMIECKDTGVHSNLKVVELICKDYLNNYEVPDGLKSKLKPLETVNLENFDLMFAYNEDRSRGILFLGHFNDGVI